MTEEMKSGHQGAESAKTASPVSITLQVGFALAVLAGLLVFYSSTSKIHHDIAGGLMSGQLAVYLGDSYSNYSIYFPPAEKAWFSLAAHMSNATGWRLDLVVVAMSYSVVLFGTGLAYYIRNESTGASWRFFVMPLLVLVIIPIIFKNVFGTREHIVAAGLWPYLVLRVSDPRNEHIGRKTRIVLGLWMGATLLIKYLYAVLVLLVELTDALMQRRIAGLFRVENLISGAIVALYLFLWLGIDPAQREAISAMLSAIDANLSDTDSNIRKASLYGLVTFFLLLLSRFFKVPTCETALSLALVAGTFIVAGMQERWYSHHLFPICMAFIVWWWMAGRQMGWWGHLAFAGAIATVINPQFVTIASYQNRLSVLDASFNQAHQSVAGKRVAILTLHPSPYNEFLTQQHALRWNPSVNIAYITAELQHFDLPENAGKPNPPIALNDPGRRILHDQMLRLWEDMPPDAILIDRTYRWPLKYIDVNWEEAFADDPRFAAIMSHYKLALEHKGPRLRFSYYVRAD